MYMDNKETKTKTNIPIRYTTRMCSFLVLGVLGLPCLVLSDLPEILGSTHTRFNFTTYRSMVANAILVQDKTQYIEDKG